MIVVALVAIMAIMLVILAMQHVNASRPAAGATAGPVPTFSSSPSRAALPAITSAAGTRTVILGDSWTVGYGADTQEHGLAYMAARDLQLDATISGISGSGYTSAGPNNEGTYQTRIEQLPADLDPTLIILQGSVNDAAPTTEETSVAVADTVEAAKTKFPNAQIVLFGPAAPQLPVSGGMQKIDRALHLAAAREEVHYISPIAQNWITVGNIKEMIDPTKQFHPSTAGHAYLAEKLEESLRKISQ
ncbi:SGNH/GDSL hydrolase family protein [Curtobacterium sp. MCBD17_030]|uniref:SGNH/GDSL hydrolase family protein n=1 Tax=Curtobacterium sp. MCBD17_030 TaxID=2175649 RepID=UPI0015E8D153|nr:SGNH/GDSL hydrolase family protein [Curtobacterium sp. MCBD17_030]